MFVSAAHLRVPFLAIVLRKGYGLGAMAMTGGGIHAPVATVAWPSGEFGAMGLEGAVRSATARSSSGGRGAERDALQERLVAEQYANGKAINMASTLEIDAVIDPAESGRWLVRPRIGAGARKGQPFHRSLVGASGQWRGCSAGRAASSRAGAVGCAGSSHRPGGSDEGPAIHVLYPIRVVRHDAAAS